MIERLAFVLSDAWAEAGVVKRTDIPLYRYGLELILSTLTNVLIIVTISLALGRTWAFFPYLLSFVPLRSFAGGYHAKTHWFCTLLCSGVFLLSVVGMPFLHGKASAVFCITCGLLSFALIYLLSPVPADNKPLTTEEIRRHRFISMSLGGALLALGAVLGWKGMTDLLSVKMLYCGELAVMLLMIGGSLTQKGKESRLKPEKDHVYKT